MVAPAASSAAGPQTGDEWALIVTGTIPEPTLDEFLHKSAEKRIDWVNSSDGFTTGTMERVGLFLSFARPRTCLPGMLAFYLGCVLLDVPMGIDVLLGFFVTFLYSAVANLFNAYSDIAEDNQNIPARLYLLGLYGRRRLLRSSYAAGAVMLVAAAVVSPAFLLLTALCLLIAHQYSLPPLRMKARPMGSLVFFALDVALPFLMAPAVVENGPAVAGNWSFLSMAAYLLLWFVAKGFVKNLPDFEGDREAGLSTSATIFATRQQAAVAAAAATVLVYLGPLFLVVAGQFEAKYLFALAWFPVACAQGARMILRDDNQSANNMLRFDMIVSTGYLSTWVLLADPSVTSLLVVAGSLVVIFAMDALKLDTRKKEDIG
ncbi:UbiA family prenyltransferase [Nocardia ignorata]|uniref:UbiA family prenyltransferase n=1 Tax=Nocardia ignorata TaxID=145285 RepID=UPI00363EF8F7